MKEVLKDQYQRDKDLVKDELVDAYLTQNNVPNSEHYKKKFKK